MKALHSIIALAAIGLIGLIGLMQSMPEPYRTPDPSLSQPSPAPPAPPAPQTPAPAPPQPSTPLRVADVERYNQARLACEANASTAIAKPEAALLAHTREESLAVWGLAYSFCLEDQGYGPAKAILARLTLELRELATLGAAQAPGDVTTPTKPRTVTHADARKAAARAQS